MGTPFSESEMRTLRERLIKTAKELLVRFGVRKTTVEQIAQTAGISTGAFYRFYDSKELLFFEVLELMHKEIYGRALDILRSRTDLPDAERMELAFLSFFSHISELGISDVWETDMDYLLRKVPEETLSNHWSDDKSHIRDLIENSGLRLSVSAEDATAIVYALTAMLSHKKDFHGDEFEKTMKFLIRAVCHELAAAE